MNAYKSEIHDLNIQSNEQNQSNIGFVNSLKLQNARLRRELKQYKKLNK